MVLPVTLVTAAACALVNLWLAVRVTRRRLSQRVLMGDGGDPLMLSRGRAHANFAEYAPFVLVLVAALELARGESAWLWALSSVFVVARIAHPIGMDRPAPNALRAGGTAATFGVLALLALWALVAVYQSAPGRAAEAVEVPSASA